VRYRVNLEGIWLIGSDGGGSSGSRPLLKELLYITVDNKPVRPHGPALGTRIDFTETLR
jgi:hypothetical protein